MPELPDVEIFRRYFEKTSLNRQIKKVSAENSVLEGVSEKGINRCLADRRFTSTVRHGKLLFAETGKQSPWLVLHFGMTGFLKHLSAGKETTPHTRMKIEFEDGSFLVFDCRRKLGRIRVTGDPDGFIREMKLGPDALDPKIGPEEFEKTIGSGRGAVKPALMNQSLIAGIGNIYADEILYQAKIHPGRKTGQITGEEFRLLYSTMHRVLEEAVRAGADPGSMPEGYLIKIREPGAVCPACGNRIEKIPVSGRNGYFCPGCQK